jgi:DNA-binding response OmpR family regulator
MPDAKIKILHVEDDKNIQLIVKAVLEKAGYQVFCALDAMQGLMLARQVQPSLIVLDIMMPAGGGHSLLERLRALNTTFATPVLVYSAADKAELETKIPPDSLTMLLQKPAPPTEILEAVKTLLAAAS